jgi:hypothetical protein
VDDVEVATGEGRWPVRHWWYVLDGHTPRAVIALEWEEAMLARSRAVQQRGEDEDPWRVAFTDLVRCTVSTVFLGVNHNMTGEGDPVLFETMVFGNDDMGGGDMRRYRTWEEAEAGHAEMVAHTRQTMLRVVGGTDHSGGK